MVGGVGCAADMVGSEDVVSAEVPWVPVLWEAFGMLCSEALWVIEKLSKILGRLMFLFVALVREVTVFWLYS